MREHTVGLLPDAFPCPGVEPVRTSLGIPVLSLQYISQVLGAHIAQHTQTFILAVRPVDVDSGGEMEVANKSSGICGVARARHQSRCAACNGLSLIIVVLKGAFGLALLCMLRAQSYPKHVSVICKMRPIPAEHPSQLGDQPDASTDEEAMSLDETADEELNIIL